ncbi:hypothetical protein Tco_1302256, partial [Tanacetum coccineum]
NAPGYYSAATYFKGVVHRTMVKTSNGNTPFSLTYGTKAVIPVEIGIPSLRLMKPATKEDTGKLCPKWEDPYEVTEELGDGAYKLCDQKGNKLPRTLNITNKLFKEVVVGTNKVEGAEATKVAALLWGAVPSGTSFDSTVTTPSIGVTSWAVAPAPRHKGCLVQ